MSELDQIVDVSISTDSKTPSRQGFGTPLFLTYHTRFPEKYRSYGSLREVAEDFESYDSAYRMAAACFSQNPTVKKVIVGRLPAAPSFTRTLTITSAVEGQLIKFKVIAPEAGTLTDPALTGGTISPTGAITAGTVVTVEYEVQAADTTTTLVADVVYQLLAAIPGITCPDPAAAVLSITPDTAGNQIWVYDLENCTTEETTADAGYDDELTALQAVNDEWYFVLTDSCSAANVALVGAWTLAAKKLYFVNTDSSGELAGTGTIGSALKALSNDRTVIIYSPNTHEFAAAAWVGVGAPKDPGSITWAYKTLRGVTPKNLNTSQRSALEADNINHYQTIAALSATRPGKVAFGEWINVIHGIDALKVRIQEDLWSAFVNSDVIPYTAAGLDVVSNIILASMKAFEGTRDVPGLLVVGSSQVIMPDFADISANDKAARRLENVRISATLTGAIHYVGIDGTISV